MRGRGGNPIATGSWYVAVALTAWSFGYTTLRGSDLWWHLAGGRWTWEHGAIPLADPWSFTHHGGPWLNDAWLADVVFYGWARAFGVPALVWWKWGVLATAFLLLFHVVRRRAYDPLASWLGVVLALAVAAPFLDVRPHLYALLGYALVLHGALGRRRPAGWLPVVILAWANLHATVVFGLAALAVTLGPAVASGDPARRRRGLAIDARAGTPLASIELPPIADTGFLANGSTIDGVPLRFNPDQTDVLDTPTGAAPNLLGSIAIKGDRAYVPSIGSSPNGPFRFDVNVQSLLNVIDLGSNAALPQATINMNRAVVGEPVTTRLFLTTPSGIAFQRNGNDGWITLAGIDQIVRVNLDGAAPSIADANDPNQPAFPERTDVGANPRGIVINARDTRAYVMNYVSRDVTVVDLTAQPAVNLAQLPSTSLPAAGSGDATVLHGKRLFNTARGPAGTVAGSLPPAGRMSDSGWGACYNCHPDGLSDGMTWAFPSGPRQTPSLAASGERVLNYSAIFDEIQDFELNIRGISGGEGLILDPNSPAPLGTPTTGRSADLDAIDAYVQTIRPPISPLRTTDVSAGRTLFAGAGCTACHGGARWTRSVIDFTPPPTGETITGGQLVRFLDDVATFDPNSPIELKPNQISVVPADGALGFNPPSLLGVFPQAPYLHDGSAPTLDAVLDNVTHRSAGSGGNDLLGSPTDRAALVRFLQSIDGATAPFSTTPGGSSLLLGYRHVAPGASGVCGSFTSGTPFPGASASATFSGPFGSTGSTTFTLSGASTGTFLLPITQIGGYTVQVQVNPPTGPTTSGSVEVTGGQGTCPGSTGRAIALGVQTGSLPIGTLVCLDQITPAPDGCVGIGMECIPGTPLFHLHRGITIQGIPGTLTDPNPTGCGRGVVLDGFSGCGSDAIPACQ